MSLKHPWYTIVVALAVVIGFGWLCIYMIDQAETLPEKQQFRWGQMVLVFNSVQTMAAAALGVLLGTAVQQARVDAAQSRAAAAETKADANADEAAKAKQVRTIVSGLQPPGGPKTADAKLQAIEAALTV